MTVVLDWYLGGCGSVTSPATDSPAPLVSRSDLVSHLRNWQRCRCSCAPARSQPWCRDRNLLGPCVHMVCLMMLRWGNSLTELRTKKSVHVPTLILVYRDNSGFFSVSSRTGSPLLPFLWKTWSEVCWRWSWEAAGFPAWNKDWNISLPSGRAAARGSRTARDELLLQLLHQLPATEEQHTGAGHPRGWGKTHRHCSGSRTSTCAFVLVFKKTA